MTVFPKGLTMSFEKTWETLAVRAHYRPGELAGLCGISLRTLQRHFSSHYGCTLGAWLKNLRMQQAYSRVARGESIKCVAYDLGFKQLSHFSRVFKEAHGIAPKVLAADLRGELSFSSRFEAGELAESRS
jgi:AraC-like DNA-binding protein